MDFQTALQTFRQSYQGPKLAFVIMGGGYGTLDFRKYPGSSAYYHTAITPYKEDLVNFLNRFGGKNIDSSEVDSFSAVNAEVTNDLLGALANYCQDSSLMYVIVNAALTTNRFRRGTNRAFIATSSGASFEYELSKFGEDSYEVLSNNNPELIDEIRKGEDDRVSQMVFSILLNNPEIAPNYPGERLTRLTGSGGGRVQVHPHSLV